MKQSVKRKHAVFLLYISEFHEKEEMEEQAELYFKCNAEEEALKNSESEDGINDTGAAEEIKAKFYAVREKLGIIDAMISSVSDGWKIDRMGRIDLAIMRMAVFEIFFDETPSPVAINEAVILAKRYGGDDSSSVFINGILGRLERNRQSNE